MCCFQFDTLPKTGANFRAKTLANKKSIELASRVQAMLCQIHHDPKHFPQPEKFQPERFLDEDGRYRELLGKAPFEGELCLLRNFELYLWKVKELCFPLKRNFSKPCAGRTLR